MQTVIKLIKSSSSQKNLNVLMIALVTLSSMAGCASDGKIMSRLKDSGQRHCALRDIDDLTCAPQGRQAKSQEQNRSF
jgi:hypothetical protein